MLDKGFTKTGKISRKATVSSLALQSMRFTAHNHAPALAYTYNISCIYIRIGIPTSGTRAIVQLRNGLMHILNEYSRAMIVHSRTHLWQKLAMSIYCKQQSSTSEPAIDMFIEYCIAYSQHGFIAPRVCTLVLSFQAVPCKKSGHDFQMFLHTMQALQSHNPPPIPNS